MKAAFKFKYSDWRPGPGQARNTSHCLEPGYVSIQESR